METDLEPGDRSHFNLRAAGWPPLHPHLPEAWTDGATEDSLHVPRPGSCVAIPLPLWAWLMDDSVTRVKPILSSAGCKQEVGGWGAGGNWTRKQCLFQRANYLECPPELCNLSSLRDNYTTPLWWQRPFGWMALGLFVSLISNWNRGMSNCSSVFFQLSVPISVFFSWMVVSSTALHVHNLPDLISQLIWRQLAQKQHFLSPKARQSFPRFVYLSVSLQLSILPFFHRKKYHRCPGDCVCFMLISILNQMAPKPWLLHHRLIETVNTMGPITHRWYSYRPHDCSSKGGLNGFRQLWFWFMFSLYALMSTFSFVSRRARHVWEALLNYNLWFFLRHESSCLIGKVCFKRNCFFFFFSFFCPIVLYMGISVKQCHSFQKEINWNMPFTEIWAVRVSWIGSLS